MCFALPKGLPCINESCYGELWAMFTISKDIKVCLQTIIYDLFSVYGSIEGKFVILILDKGSGVTVVLLSFLSCILFVCEHQFNE